MNCLAIRFHILFLLMITKVSSQEVLKTIVKRSVPEETDTVVKQSNAETKTKVDLAISNVHVIEQVEDRMHYIEKKTELNKILETGLNCEAIHTIYILKSNVYSCYDLYLPIMFYGFLPDTINPKNFSSILMEGFLPNGNGTDVIQKAQKKTEHCIFYMR